jgi:hypothetical protein
MVGWPYYMCTTILRLLGQRGGVPWDNFSDIVFGTLGTGRALGRLSFYLYHSTFLLLAFSLKQLPLSWH